MLKIQEIKVTNNYVLITLDNKSKYKISEDDYFENKFKANQTLSKAQVANIEKIANFHAAYMRALNRLKYKDRTEWEIRNTMYEEFSLLKPEVDKIINKLIRYDFINDKRYVLELIAQSQLKYHGFNKIKDSLIKVRINSNLISELLVYDEEKELAIALAFAKKSLKSIKNHNFNQTKNKLRSRLLYRGFKSSLITRVIEQINVPYNYKQEKELLIKDLNKVLRRYKSKYEEYELRSKVFNYLATRGYNFDMINEVLEEMENSYE